MKKQVSCEFNMDTGGGVVEWYADGSIYDIQKLNKRRERAA